MSINIYRKGNWFGAVMLSVLFIPNTACKKFVTLGPPKNALSVEATFSSESNATAALLDIYPSIQNFYAGVFNSANVVIASGMYSDEYTLTSTEPTYMAVHTNSLDAANTPVRLAWNHYYAAIYKCNAFQENLAAYGGPLPQQLRDQLMGEAKFIRAFAYFNLVNLFGDVPLLLTSDYRVNLQASRTPKATVYNQVLTDLEDAGKLVRAEYINDKNVPGNIRLRPNKDVVTAFKARVYLFMERWEEARLAATEIINKSGVYSLEPGLTNVFNTNSKEAIWQLVQNGISAFPAVAVSVILSGPPTNIASGSQIGVLSNNLLSSFQAGDNRGSNAWVGAITSGGNTYYFPNKYRTATSLTQYFTFFRLSEMYLIRAEAYIQEGNITDGVADLNFLRNRARAQATVQLPDPLPAVEETISEKEAMQALEYERRVELYMEGHRWFDMKRWKGFDDPAKSRAEELMPAITLAKGSTWDPYKLLFPIPQNEILLNTNMKQNKGYEQ